MKRKLPLSLKDHASEESPARHCGICDVILSAYSKRKYCSYKCMGAARRVRIFTCIICRKEYEPKSRTQDSTKQTCGPACLKVLVGFNSSRLRSKRYTEQAPCPICGTIFNVYGKMKHKRTACSRTCSVKLAWRKGRKPVDYTKLKRDEAGNFVK